MLELVRNAYSQVSPKNQNIGIVLNNLYPTSPPGNSDAKLHGLCLVYIKKERSTYQNPVRQDN
jgi:hypothetical protein